MASQLQRHVVRESDLAKELAAQASGFPTWGCGPVSRHGKGSQPQRHAVLGQVSRSARCSHVGACARLTPSHLFNVKCIYVKRQSHPFLIAIVILYGKDYAAITLFQFIII